MVIIAGGAFETESDKTDVEYLTKIFYAFSDDLHTMKNVWQTSDVTLPIPIAGCQCIITNYKKHPKLHIIGGQDSAFKPVNLHLVYDLHEIIGAKKCQKMYPGLKKKFFFFG